MIKVLDLFAGTQSVKKALTEMYEIDYWDHFNGIWRGIKEDRDLADTCTNIVVEYVGLDIYSPEDENIIIDLSRDDIVKKIQELRIAGFEFDFIWSSPPCNKVSAAITGPRGNGYFLKAISNQTGKLELLPRIDFSNVKHNRMYLHKERWKEFNNDAKLALKLHKNTKAIIDFFNVPFVIENPYTSLAGIIYSDLIRNKAEYCAYGFEYRKPTGFWTNKELILKKHNKNDNHRCLRFDRINQTNNWPNHWNKNVSTYANRSSVPPELIKEIISQLI